MQVAGPETQDDDAGSLKTIFYALGFVLFLAGQGTSHLVNHMKDTAGNPKAPAWIDTTFIVALALTEAIAVFGLVLGFGGTTIQNSLPLL